MFFTTLIWFKSVYKISNSNRYGIKKLVRIIENSSTTFSPEFCGIDHVGAAVEAFAVREWSGDLACLKSMAAFNFKWKLMLWIIYINVYCLPFKPLCNGFLTKKYITRNRSAIQCCSVNKILNFFLFLSALSTCLQ